MGSLLLTYRRLAADTTRVTARPRLDSILAAYRPLIRHRPMLGLIAASLLGNAGVWAAWTYVGAFFIEQHGYTSQQVGWVFMVAGVAVLLGSLAMGGRLSTAPLRPLLIGSRVASGLLTGAALLAPLPALAAASLLTLGLVMTGISMVAIPLLLTQETPAGRATTLTLNGSAYSVGIALGGGLGGLLLALSGYSAIGLSALLLLAAAGGLVWWARPGAVAVPAPATPPVIGD